MDIGQIWFNLNLWYKLIYELTEQDCREIAENCSCKDVDDF